LLRLALFAGGGASGGAGKAASARPFGGDKFLWPFEHVTEAPSTKRPWGASSLRLVSASASFLSRLSRLAFFAGGGSGKDAVAGQIGDDKLPDPT